MPACVPTRGVLKASTNRVRTSTALQGNAMWENVIGISEAQAGTNEGVEALINAPVHGGGRKAALARRAAAAEAVMATGGFDTAITNYQSLLSLAKTQGAVGGNATRGACRVCGQLGHLSKQCRNQFSKYFDAGAAGEAGSSAEALVAAQAALRMEAAEESGLSDSGLSSDSDDSADERRRRKRKEKKEKKHRSHKESHRHKSSKSEHKSNKRRHKEKSSSKDKKESKRRRRSSSGSSGSGSD